MNVSTRTQVPCGDVDFDQALSVDYMDPCATGGCLASPECSSGGCRLEQLDGRWTCCQCGRGGNEYRWCRHRMTCAASIVEPMQTSRSAVETEIGKRMGRVLTIVGGIHLGVASVGC